MNALVEVSPDHHQIAHSLVLYHGTESSSLTPVLDNPADVKLVALQEQVGSLHGRLDSLETRMEERLTRLEQMLVHIASALGAPAVAEVEMNRVA